MDEIASTVGTISGLRTTGYGAPTITPPAAWCEWPDTLDFDVAMARGGDRITLPLRVAVGAIDARSSTDELAAYVDGSGPRSIKAVIQAHTPVSYGSARVTGVEFGVVVIASVDYLAATFFIDIIGTGS